MTLIKWSLISHKSYGQDLNEILLCLCSFENPLDEQILKLSLGSFSVAKATLDSRMSVYLSVCPSVRLSVTETPQPLRIAPIGHQAYQPLSLSTNKPINQWAYQPSGLSTIKPINHQAYWPSSLSTSGLLSRLLRLSACSKLDIYEIRIRIKTQNFYTFASPLFMQCYLLPKFAFNCIY